MPQANLEQRARDAGSRHVVKDPSASPRATPAPVVVEPIESRIPFPKQSADAPEESTSATSSDRLSSDILETVPNDPEFAESWDSLVLVMARPEVFYTHEWALAAARAFSESLHPMVVRVFEGDILRGVVPLARLGRSPDKVVFLGDTTADYCDVVCHPAHNSRVIGATLEALRAAGLKTWTLSNVPKASPSIACLSRMASSSGAHVAWRSETTCRVVAFAGQGQRAEIRQAATSKKSVQRHLNALRRIGAVQVEHLTTWDDARDAFPQFFNSHIARFLSTQRLSPYLEESRRNFLMLMGELISQRGWLQLSRLTVDGEPVAWNVGMRYGSRVFWYAPTFDPRLERLWPGEVLLAELIGNATLDQGIGEVDLGIGEEFYKTRFATTTRENMQGILNLSHTRQAVTAVRNTLIDQAARHESLDHKLRSAQEQLAVVRGKVAKEGLLAAATSVLRRVRQSLWSEVEVAVFRFPGPNPPEADLPHHDPLQAVGIDWHVLAAFALCYADDPPILSILLRTTRHLRSGREGYAGVTNDGTFAHLAWLAPFHDFWIDEIEAILPGVREDAEVISDCWTPPAERGRGHYTAMIRGLAKLVMGRGREAWIFASVNNAPSLRGIQAAGFEKVGTATHSRRLGMKKTRLERWPGSADRTTRSRRDQAYPGGQIQRMRRSDARDLAESVALGTFARAGVFDLVRKRRIHDICALTYHDILPAGFDASHPAFGMAVSTEDFAWQMAHVKQHFSPISLDEMLGHVESGAVLPPHPLLVTFDDGRRNLITHALPILQRYGIPAVAFVLSDFVGGPPQPTWAEDVQLRMMASQASSISTTDGRKLPLDTKSNRASAAGVFFDLIRSLPLDAVRRELEWLVAQLPEQGDEVSRHADRFQFLDEGDCRRLQSEGMSIQSHGQDHTLLRCLDGTGVERQLAESRAAIQRITGHEVYAFAYPFGEPGLDFGARDERSAGAAGYRLAFAATGGYLSRNSRVLALPRISIDHAACQPSYFQYALSGLHDAAQSALSVLRV